MAGNGGKGKKMPKKSRQKSKALKNPVVVKKPKGRPSK